MNQREEITSSMNETESIEGEYINDRVIEFENQRLNLGAQNEEDFMAYEDLEDILPEDLPDTLTDDPQVPLSGSSMANSAIDPALEQYLSNMKYPKIIFDKKSMTSQKHHTMTSKGQLDERGKQIFQYINRIVTHVTTTGIKLSSLKTYETHMIRYIMYVSEHKTIQVEKFTIQGTWMLECIQHVMDENPKVSFASIPQFNYALVKLQSLIAKYKTASITDPNEKASKELLLRRIKNIHVLHDYYNAEKTYAHNTLLSRYLDKGRYKIYQPKYSIIDAKNMMIAMLKQSGSTNKAERQNGICASIAFLIDHMLQRGDNKCKIKLSDAVYTDEETHNGIVPILGFHCVTGKKMNENSEPGLSGVCRNKDVEICLVSAFALSLWYRFDFGHMDAPFYYAGSNALDFLDIKSWYDPKINFNTSETQKAFNVPVSATHMQHLAALCFNKINFVSAHNQHAGRQVNPKRADAFGVDESQIRRAGRWKLDVLQQKYISSYAYDFIHYSAGFKPEEPYFIPRDIEVPESLQKQIFPWLEQTIELVANRNDKEKKGKYENDEAVVYFLRMLLKFRSIILQDLALLSELVPESVYSMHPITSDPEFIKFREAIRHATKNSTIFNCSREVEEAFDRACPVIAKAISVLKTGIEKIDQYDQNILSQIEKNDQNILSQIEKCFQLHKQTLRSQESGQSYLAQVLQSILYQMSILTQQNYMLVDRVVSLENKFDASQRENKESRYIMLSKQHQPMGIPLLPIEEGDLNTECTPELASSTTVQALNEDDRSTKKRKRAPDTKSLNDPPFQTAEFDISNPTTVQELMCEFYDPQPRKLSIAQRDEKYQARWRTVLPSRLTQHKKMKAAINVINEVHKFTNLLKDEVANFLERYRLEHNWDMNKLMNNMRNPDLAKGVVNTLIRISSRTQDQESLERQ